MITERVAGMVGLMRDAAPAAAASATTGVIAAVTSAPTWLVAVAQAVIVILGVLGGYDKRERKRNARMAALEKKIASIPCLKKEEGE